MVDKIFFFFSFLEKEKWIPNICLLSLNLKSSFFIPNFVNIFFNSLETKIANRDEKRYFFSIVKKKGKQTFGKV